MDGDGSYPRMTERQAYRFLRRVLEVAPWFFGSTELTPDQIRFYGFWDYELTNDERRSIREHLLGWG